MRRLTPFAAVLALTIAEAASAQPRQAQPVLTGIDALRADFIARTGGQIVYFAGDSHLLSAQARTQLAAQAQWLRLNPVVVARIEGHADPSDTRSHAFAVGARRAQEVRDYLVLLGVPAAQLSLVSWGKEKPGPARTVTVLVR